MMSPSPDHAASATPSSGAGSEFSADERRLLLWVAHEAILSTLEQRKLVLTPPSLHLAEPRGAFTTLYHQGRLHGCVGYVLPVASLYATVAETARSAAFDDARFNPVTLAEARELEISLSVLSPLHAIQPDEVEIGRHGLLISRGGRRGLLLPQVPAEHSWDRITFLEQTCHKAGLPPDAWREGAKIEAFTAEIFGDADLK